MAKNKKANRKAIAKKMVKVQTKPSQSASVGHLSSGYCSRSLPGS